MQTKITMSLFIAAVFAALALMIYNLQTVNAAPDYPPCGNIVECNWSNPDEF